MRTILLALLLFLIAPGQLVGSQMLWVPLFEIEASESVRPFADRVRRIDPNAFATVKALIVRGRSGELNLPIKLVLLDESSPAARATPPWIAAFADGRASTIVVFPARANTYPHDSFEDVVRHEVAHVLIARAANGQFVPRWFHEGLALATERPWGVQDRTRLLMAVTFERVSFADVERAFGGGERQATQAYAIAGAIVRDIFRRHDPTVAARILAAMGPGVSFERAYLTATGETLAEAETVFWRNNWWHQLVPLLTSSVIVWGVVMLLAVYARRARARRRAAFERQWAEEDAARHPDNLLEH